MASMLLVLLSCVILINEGSSTWVWKGDKKSFPGQGSVPLVASSSVRQGHAIRINPSSDPVRQSLQTVPSHQNAIPFPPYNQEQCSCIPSYAKCSLPISSEQVGCGNGQVLCCDGQRSSEVSDSKGSVSSAQVQLPLGAQASVGLASSDTQRLQQLQVQQLLLEQQKDRLLQLQRYQQLPGLQQQQQQPGLAGLGHNGILGSGGGLGHGNLLALQQQQQLLPNRLQQQAALQQQLLLRQQLQQQQLQQQGQQLPHGPGLTGGFPGSQLHQLNGGAGHQLHSLGGNPHQGFGFSQLQGLNGNQFSANSFPQQGIPGIHGFQQQQQQQQFGLHPSQQFHPQLHPGQQFSQGIQFQHGSGGLPHPGIGASGQFPGAFAGGLPGGGFPPQGFGGSGPGFHSQQFPGAFRPGQQGFPQQGFGGSPFATEAESSGTSGGASSRPGGSAFANSQGSSGGGLIGQLFNRGQGGGGGNFMTELLSNVAGGGGGQGGLSSLLGGNGGGEGLGFMNALLGGGLSGRSAGRVPGPFPLARTAPELERSPTTHQSSEKAKADSKTKLASGQA